MVSPRYAYDTIRELYRRYFSFGDQLYFRIRNNDHQVLVTRKSGATKIKDLVLYTSAEALDYMTDLEAYVDNKGRVYRRMTVVYRKSVVTVKVYEDPYQNNKSEMKHSRGIRMFYFPEELHDTYPDEE